MKAYVLHGVNDLRYEEVAKPYCPIGWAVIKVKAAGICSSDIPRIYTKGTYHFPTIPGHELAGIVDSVGCCSDSLLIGKHVGVFPLIPCKECNQCKEKHYEMCAHYDYVGSRRDGGFAEYVAVPVWNLIELPPDMSFAYAAMLEPLAVALHAIKAGQIQKGNSVGIIGTGTIGICAAQWAHKFGANKVTVVGRSESKRALVENIGLCYATEVSDEFDVVLEAVGNVPSIISSIYATATGGKLVLMGNPSGNIELPQEVYWRILRKQLTVKGTWNSSYDGNNPSEWHEVIDALQRKEIQVDSLISHYFNQEQLKDGLELMRNHVEPYCKVMTLWNRE